MTISHHPGPESLMSCSAGSMPEPFAAVMASHLTICPACREDLALMQEIGVALFDGIVPEPVSRDAPVLQMRGAESEHGTPVANKVSGDVPAPLVSAIGPKLDAISWAHVAPGVWQHVIPLSQPSRGTLRLIRVAAGQALPAHGHDGSELTLVLRGSFTDASGHYRPGDVADLGQETEHTPVADPVDGCICLVATEGKLRFKSPLARLVQPFTGL